MSSVQFVGDPRHDEPRLRFLIAVGETLATSLDYQTTLASVARLAVPFLADLCVIDILDSTGIRPIAVAHVDEAAEAVVRAMRARYPLDLASPAPVAQVMRTGEPLLFPVVPDELQYSISQAEEHYEILRSLRYRSAIVVPIHAHSATVGTIMLVSTAGDRHYGAGDLHFAEEFATRAAAAVDNARLFAAEQQARLRAELAVTRLERLLEVSTALSGAVTAGEVSEIVVRQAIDVLGAMVGMVMQMSADETAIEMAGQVNFPSDVLDGWQRIPLDLHVPATDAVLRREPIWIHSRQEVAARYPALATVRTTGANAFAAIPLIAGGTTIGVMGLSFAEARQFSDEDRTFATLLAQQGAFALERARLFDAELRARAAAEAAVREREQFLSIAAHELKTPLTSVKGFAQMLMRALREPAADAERIKRFSTALESQVRRLEELVAELLDVSRIEQGRLSLRLEPADLEEIIRRALGQFDAAPERGDRRRFTVLSAGSVIGEWDAGRIEQVLVNLISNAIKYSRDDGAVTIQLDVDGEHAVVAVSDEGIGIASEDLPRVFEPFTRAIEARHTVAGAGLGLYIAAGIVGAHDGTLTVESELGAGSTFTVRLPLRPA